jgi:hypothetical protein
MAQHVKVYGSDGTSEVALKVDANGNLTTTASAATYTNRSSTIATGGTAQAFAAANTSRRGYRVQNLSGTNLYINDKGATAVATQTGASFTLIPGAMYESSGSGVSTAAISIIGATTSQAFEGAEW